MLYLVKAECADWFESYLVTSCLMTYKGCFSGILFELDLTNCGYKFRPLILTTPYAVDVALVTSRYLSLGRTVLYYISCYT